MRYAGPVTLAAGFGVAALFLAIAAGGPCEDGTAADFRTVACDPRDTGLDTLRVALFVVSPVLALAGGLVGARMGLRWPLVTGVVEATLALAAAVWVGTLDQPAPEVESISVAPTTCESACPQGVSVRLAPGAYLVLVQPASGETAQAQFSVSR